jgi:class 3 adenylate cyclase
MSSNPEIVTVYQPPEVIAYPGKWLVVDGATGPEGVFLFFDRIVVGRLNEKKRGLAGHLGVQDPTVSSRHCVITQEPDGRCYVRDMSRNGTRLDGRRLTPNMTTEITVGQELSIGRSLRLRLDGQAPEFDTLEDPTTDTYGVGEMSTVTVLVGDIRNYTTLVRIAGTADLQQSVNRVFERLEREVEAQGGTLKELQGDALFAFWEKNSDGCQACRACRAALNLKKLVAKLASDPAVWNVGGHPLGMDFALATGLVTISGYGSDGALGLSMVGESVVLAYRIEKFANKSTGPIIVCPLTQRLAKDEFKFKDLGERTAKGFDTAHHLFSLVKERR